jgi:glutamine---fructose-6-phosphate transaminase (isomerizing)
MCGIVGYIGTRDAYPILIKGLKRLEYRGYDSAGVALVAKANDMRVYKARGKISNLEKTVGSQDVSGTMGMAHTRWATHGEPSTENAHPHCSQSGNLALVHNGIIENYADLRERLQQKGFVFKSATDTEVLVQFIEYIQQKYSTDLLSATRIALNKVIGAYAIVVFDRRNPDQMIAARKSSPLVVGIGQDNSEFYIASDATPIAEYTKNMFYCGDEEIVVLERNKPLKVVNLQNDAVDPKIQHVEMDMGMLEKGGFPHFMLKEIFDQPKCIADCMRGRLLMQYGKVVLSAVTDHKEELLKAHRFIIVACGTSWHAALIGKQIIEELCRIPVEVEYASEFRYRDPVLTPEDVVIAVSQSGETADTLAAIQMAKERGCKIFGIVNAVGSSISRASETGTYIHVGPEIGVASTKAFTGQVTVMAMLALAIGRAKGTVSAEMEKTYVEELNRIPEKMKQVLLLNDKIELLSRMFTYCHNFLYLGRGVDYPVALEGALKLKEISYIHAEGYPAAEMKHGPIALVDSEIPVVFIAPHDELYKKIISNMQEVKARQGRIIAIVTKGDTEVTRIADYCLEIPETLNNLSPLLTVLPLQMLAYHVAVQKGLNVDQPRNLAKSVTVE